MRSRSVREGSVGLLILVGLGLLGGITIWLRGLEVGRTSYSAIVEFENANGMSIGAPVRYRGVNVGKIVAIEPGTNGIDVKLQISPVELLIPKDAVVKANQSGLISQTAIDIIPLRPLSSQAQTLSPISQECDSTEIVCDRDRLQGEAGATIDDLLISTVRLSEVYGSPEFAANLNRLLATAETTAVNVAQLSTELQQLSRLMRQQLPQLTGTARATSVTLNTTALEIGDAANRVAGTLEGFSGTVQEYEATARSLNSLSNNLNLLIDENRASLTGTLASVRETSESLQDLVTAFRPTANGLNTALDPASIEQLIDNLEVLVANSSEASANLRDLSASFNDPTLILELQQTLNSARETFENTRKITSEIDDLTGDPSFRENLRRLVNGLGNLLSSTQELEQQIQLAQALESYRQTVQELETSLEVAQNLRQELQPQPTTQPGVAPPSQTPQVLVDSVAQPKAQPTWRKN
jgi:phospholipid/cholesterol/gamma-HCH transport system substrate-binding protein